MQERNVGKILGLFITIIGILLVIFLSIPMEIQGENLVVDDSGGKDYERIQDALDNATEGDVILVENGIYTENIMVNSSVTIIGNGPSRSIIQGSGGGDVIQITADRVIVQGFNIAGNVEQGAFTGIKVEADNVTILENQIWDHHIGICLDNADHNVLSNNSIIHNEIGILLTNGSLWDTANYNTIQDNTMSGIDCSGNDGIGINATNNRWGNFSGPYHPDANPNGEGDNVTGPVIFDPWVGKVENEAPVAFIDSITPEIALKGEMVTVRGHAVDDGEILEYSWRSSRDGIFATTATFTLVSLTQGNHTIYFCVKDDHGIWSNEAFRLIQIHERPQVEILSISPNPAIVGMPVTISGSATDDGFIINYAWRSHIDGELKVQQAEFTTSSFSLGHHIIYFKALDNNGIWSEEVSIAIDIIEPEEEKDDIESLEAYLCFGIIMLFVFLLLLAIIPASQKPEDAEEEKGEDGEEDEEVYTDEEDRKPGEGKELAGENEEGDGEYKDRERVRKEEGDEYIDEDDDGEGDGDEMKEEDEEEGGEEEIDNERYDEYPDEPPPPPPQSEDDIPPLPPPSWAIDNKGTDPNEIPPEY